MNDPPERIYIFNVTAFQPSSCGVWESRKDALHNIEYIRKDIAFPRVSKEDIDKLEAIKNELKQDSIKNTEMEV